MGAGSSSQTRLEMAHIHLDGQCGRIESASRLRRHKYHCRSGMVA
jgi:hypothetical protein